MLIKQFDGDAVAVIDADPDHVFALLTDIRRLTIWNRRIGEVLQAPIQPLATGVGWKVRMVVPLGRWVSTSQVLTFDPAARVFQHRSCSAGTPTYVDWTWTVTPDPHASRVSVRWHAEVRTFWRRLLFSRLRRVQLAAEVEASLDALAYHAASTHAAPWQACEGLDASGQIQPFTRSQNARDLRYDDDG